MARTYALVALAALLVATCARAARPDASPQVAVESIPHAAFARWIVHHANYAVSSTHSRSQNGYPNGNVLSISDGAPGNSTGRLLFYVATISQFAADVLHDPRMALTLTAEQADGASTCQDMDPEWPFCARVSIQGDARVIPTTPDVEAMMFDRHPHMRIWASLAHKWSFIELDVKTVFILDSFGGWRPISPVEYFKAQPAAPR